MRIILVLLVVMVSAAWGRAQDPVFTLSVDVPLVSLDVAVFDSKGKAVSTLAKDDFQVFEDGQLREIRNFSPVDAAYNVVLLLDRSGSTSKEMSLLQKAVDQFVSKQRQQDRLVVAAFDHKIEVLRGTPNPGNDPKKLTTLKEGQTDLYGALTWAIGEFDAAGGRRAVIVYTDGQDQRVSIYSKAEKDLAYQALLNTVGQSGVSFNFVAVNTDRNPSKGGNSPTILRLLPEVRGRMEQLVDVSGGRILFPKQVDDVGPLYDQISKELAASYSLGYAPATSTDGRSHRIEVRLSNKSLRIWQSRTGYSVKNP